MDFKPPKFQAAWDKDHQQEMPGVSDTTDNIQLFTSEIDAKIDFDERYEVVGCIELSTASSAYARFKFVYFILSLAEQFGFYWITVYGTVKYGYFKWLNLYIVFLAIAGFISALSSVIMGRLSDRFGRKYIILISILTQCIPYIPMLIFPEKLELFLYTLPVIGVCGSVHSLTGVMKAYIVDSLHTKFLISGFAKLVSVYSGAGVLCAIMVYTIIGNEIRNFFVSNDIITMTTQMIMLTTVVLYIIAFVLFALLVPESLHNEYLLKYRKRNPFHGITHICNNSVVIYTAIFIFLCGFAQIGIMAVVEDIFLIDFDIDNYEQIDLVTTLNTDNGGLNTQNNNGESVSILGDDLAIYGAFLFTLGCTLICAPCCVKCFCGKAVTNMLCSMILMTISFVLIIILLISSEWYTFIIALLCGILFAMGEIGFAFLNGFIAKYVNSKQYGIVYGVLHSIYSLSKACSPYAFWILFETFTQTTHNSTVISQAKPVVYIAMVCAMIGIFIGVCALKKAMRKYRNFRDTVIHSTGVHKLSYTDNTRQFTDQNRQFSVQNEGLKEKANSMDKIDENMNGQNIVEMHSPQSGYQPQGFANGHSPQLYMQAQDSYPVPSSSHNVQPYSPQMQGQGQIQMQMQYR